MKLHILTFGIARDIMGDSDLQLPASDVATVGQLKKSLLKKYPALSEVGSFMVAVNSTYATDAVPINLADEIAIIPPVSGG